MSQAYCNTCKEIIPLNSHIKKAVCKCGGKDLIVVCGRWNDKCGWDYFDRRGRFLKFVEHIPFGVEQPEIENKPKFQQLQLKL